MILFLPGVFDPNEAQASRVIGNVGTSVPESVAQHRLPCIRRSVPVNRYASPVSADGISRQRFIACENNRFGACAFGHDFTSPHHGKQAEFIAVRERAEIDRRARIDCERRPLVYTYNAVDQPFLLFREHKVFVDSSVNLPKRVATPDKIDDPERLVHSYDYRGRRNGPSSPVFHPENEPDFIARSGVLRHTVGVGVSVREPFFGLQRFYNRLVGEHFELLYSGQRLGDDAQFHLARRLLNNGVSVVIFNDYRCFGELDLLLPLASCKYQPNHQKKEYPFEFHVLCFFMFFFCNHAN